MPQATTTRKSTQAHVGIGAGVSARAGSKASPGRLANYQMVAMGVIIAGAVYVDQWWHRER